jgi:hypothetical protein
MFEEWVFIGLCPFEVVKQEIILEDGEYVESPTELDVIEADGTKRKIRKTRVRVPKALPRTAYTINTEYDEKKRTIEQIVMVNGKVYDHVLRSRIRKGPILNSHQVHSECGILVDAWRSLRDVYRTTVASMMQDLKPTTYIRYQTASMTTEAALAVLKLKDSIAKQYRDITGAVSEDAELRVNTIQKNGDTTLLPPHLEVSPNHGPRSIFNVNLEAEHARFVMKACAVFRVPPSMIGYGIIGLSSKSSKSAHIMVEEERARMLQDFRYLADDISYALRDVYLRIYGEMCPRPVIPLRCIATLEELREARAMRAIAREEMIRMARRALGLATSDRQVRMLLEEEEVEDDATMRDTSASESDSDSDSEPRPKKRPKKEVEKPEKKKEPEEKPKKPKKKKKKPEEEEERPRKEKKREPT